MYIEQTDERSCAPIVIMNALKWANKNHINDLEWFREKCKCSDTGTNLSDLDEAIKYFEIATEYYSNPSLSLIKKELNIGNAALIIYFDIYRGKEIGHTMLCIGHTPNHYKVINWNKGFPVQQIRSNVFKHLIGIKSKWQEKSRVYFIERQA